MKEGGLTLKDVCRAAYLEWIKENMSNVGEKLYGVDMYNFLWFSFDSDQQT